jgi:hypothetical protein
VLAGAEDGVDSRHAADGAAARARLALVARGGGVVEVVAAGPLVEVAAVGGGIAQLRAGAGEDRRGEQRVARGHARVVGGLVVGDQRTETQAAAIELLDPGERQPADVDHMLRPLDVLLHQVDEVRPAGEEARRRAAAATDRVGDVARAGVVEADHRAPPSCASTATMASVMFV